MRSDSERLQDILDAIGKIQARLPASEAGLLQDEMLAVWVVHHLQTIGEATRGLSAEFRAEHPEIEWAKITAMRNILVHEYFGLDLHQVWISATCDLPALRQRLLRLFNS